MRNVLAIILAILIIASSCTLLIFGIYLIEKNIYCPRFGQQVELPTKYSFWAGGCFVQDSNGQWVESGNYHAVNLEK